MKRRERRAGLERMRAYIATLQPLMRLQHWDIVVGEEPPSDPGYAAEVGTMRRSWHAEIRFGDCHFGHAPEEQRLTVIHKLLHVVERTEYVAVCEVIEGLEQTSQAWARERFDHENERSIDALSRILGPLLPLPPADEAKPIERFVARQKPGAVFARIRVGQSMP